MARPGLLVTAAATSLLTMVHPFEPGSPLPLAALFLQMAIV